MTDGSQNIQILLERWREGDAGAQSRLFDAVYAELSTIASFLLRREADDVALSTGDLVNDAALRLLQSNDIALNDKAHFLALSARVMRRVLIDAARKREAEKRRKITVTFSGDETPHGCDVFEFQALETALTRLKAIDPERAEIVIMRYYGGMTSEEIASILGVSESTVKRSWRAARAWLKKVIEHDR